MDGKLKAQQGNTAVASLSSGHNATLNLRISENFGWLGAFSSSPSPMAMKSLCLTVSEARISGVIFMCSACLMGQQGCGVSLGKEKIVKFL